MVTPPHQRKEPMTKSHPGVTLDEAMEQLTDTLTKTKMVCTNCNKEIKGVAIAALSSDPKRRNRCMDCAVQDEGIEEKIKIALKGELDESATTEADILFYDELAKGRVLRRLYILYNKALQTARDEGKWIGIITLQGMIQSGCGCYGKAYHAVKKLELDPKDTQHE